jgi:protein gp37
MDKTVVEERIEEKVVEIKKIEAVFVKIMIESPINDLEMLTKRSSIKITKIKKLKSFQSIKLGT